MMENYDIMAYNDRLKQYIEDDDRWLILTEIIITRKEVNPLLLNIMTDDWWLMSDTDE